MFEHVLPSMSTEKLPYSTFTTRFVAHRMGQFGDFYPDVSGMTFPLGSVVHTIRNFTSLSDLDSVVPETDYPVITKETVPVYLDIHKDCAHPTSHPLGVGETMRYQPMKYYQQAVSFFRTNLRIHRLLTPNRIGMLGSSLIWTDYSILKKISLTGTFTYYRKFDIIFRTILDRISEIGTDRHHYIWVPQGDALYSKSLARKAAEHLWTDSVPDRGDASLFVLVHLFSFVLGLENNLTVQPYKPEKVLLKKDGSGIPDVRSTSLFERLDPSILDVLNLVLVKDGKCVVYNLGDIKTFGEKSGFFNKLYAHAMGLRTEWIAPEDNDSDTLEEDEASLSAKMNSLDNPDFALGVRSDDPKPVSLNTPSATPAPKPPRDAIKPVAPIPEYVRTTASGETKPVSPKETPTPEVPESSVVAPEPPPLDYESHIRAAVEEQKARLDKETKQLAKTDQLLNHHLSVQFHGQPLGSYLRTETATPLQSDTLGHLSNLPDESYKHNRVVSFDRDYRHSGVVKDTAKVLSSLTKEGLFIRSIDHTTVNNEVDHVTHYKVSMVDVTGKSHSIAFSYPVMDKNGRMRIGGVTYTMRKQIVNVPICKISPTRVNLSSNYNKSIVERDESQRTRFDVYIGKYLEALRSADLITTAAGRYTQKDQFVPFDYSAIAQRYQKISFGKTALSFQYPHRLDGVSDPKSIVKNEARYGVYLGTLDETKTLYMDSRCGLHAVEKDKVVQSWRSIVDFLDAQFGETVTAPPMPNEFTKLVLLSGKYPLGIVLAYRFGLKALLNMIKLEYVFYPKGTPPQIGVDDISIKFANGTMVFSRYPLSRSLIMAGLNWCDLSRFTTDALEVKATYADIFEAQNLSINYLKGIDNFFDFFVDPITLEVLQSMHEPTNARDLLLRANVMLSDWTAEPSSVIRNHRVRGQERYAGFLYSEMAQTFANWRNVKTKKKGFSINPTEVHRMISRDQTTAPADIINPLHEAKDALFFTFSGTQGRTQASFVTKDRVMARDGMGSISEAFPDSGMVGINGYLSTNAKIKNTRGLFEPTVTGDDIERLTAPEILSIVNMVMPGTSKDSLKRANYASIQASHILPNHDYGSTTAVRTGYEKVLAHITSDVFATKATGTGVVTDVDNKAQVVRVKYDDTKMPVLRKESVGVSTTEIDNGVSKKQLLGILVPDNKIDEYPDGAVLSLTSRTNGIVRDRLRFTDPDKLPPTKDLATRTKLSEELRSGKIKGVYFVSLELVGVYLIGETATYDFSPVLTPNAGSYILQKRKPLVAVGDHVKMGDVLTYNIGFFQPSFNEKQVTFKHGVISTIILMEKSTNHEDACEASPEAAERFGTHPSHVRHVNLTADMEIDQIKGIGTFVEATDPLCRLITSDVAELLKADPSALDSGLTKLGKSEPPAKYYGDITDIKVYYGCSKEDMSDTLRALVTQYEKHVKKRYDVLNVPKEDRIPNPGYIAPGTSFHGEDFTQATVLVEFMITGPLDLGPGDKLCVGCANKTIPAVISEKGARLESGEPVDFLFSTKSVENRIVSAFYDGFIERNIHVATQQGLEKYDELMR